MKAEKLVMMANQIGAFFASQKGGEAAHGIVDHIKKFWDPRMHAALLAHLVGGGEALDRKVRNAVELLSHEQSETLKG
jgi:formate dehydrogenase subunit delta